MIRAALALALALAVAGCPQADILAGKKSEAQMHHERLSLAGVPVVNPWHEPEPCVEIHRVTRCVDGVAEDWYK